MELGNVEIESLTYTDGCFTVQGCLLSRAAPETVYQVSGETRMERRLS